VDVVLVGLIGAFVFGGLRSGFVKRVIGLGFVVIAFLASAYLRYPIGWIASAVAKDIPPDYANLVGGTIAFPLVLGGLHLASRAVLNRLRIEGLSKGIDSVLGAVFGGLEAILILSAVIVVVDAYYRPDAVSAAGTQAGVVKEVATAFNRSETVHLLRGTTVPVVVTILGPLLPKDLTSLVPTGLPGGLPGVPGRSPKP
jgi:uncharacterized membrane protein required for colicin V production